MIQKLLLTLLISSTLYGAGNAPTTTTTTFGNEVSAGKDKHGNPIFNRTVTIKTDNYKVDNFWKKFSFSGSGQDSMDFQSIAKAGTMRISVEATSLCNLYPELDKAGCSGQKPFLINNEAVPATYDTNISLIFNRTQNVSDYNNSSDSVFYPLDVERTDKYYKTDHDGDEKSFFGFFRQLFSLFFGTGSSVSTPSTPTEDIRQRYMANVVSGIDQDHLLEKNITVVNNALNVPVSFIDYSSTTTTAGTCRLGFFTFPDTSLLCNFPFFSQTTPPITVVTDTITEDTESSIIAFAGTYIGDDINDYNTQSTEVVILENQNTGFFSIIKCFFFGCSQQTTTVVRGNNYTFPNDTGITMTLAVTNDGTKVDDFEHFRLQGIRSVVGEDAQCEIKKRTCFMFMCSYVDFTATPTVVRNAASYDGLSAQQWLSWCNNNDDGIYHDLSAFSLPFIGSRYKVLSNSQQTGSSLVLDLKRIKLDTNDTSVTLRYKLMNTTN